ncbi:hypothetical protein IPO96_01440 [Candidatus Saccharibacteria bacterium]|jgi:hypothetical protein|nr:MAG: hypothetical protein IPO96_01440 [Candidatus Saccharibacteria bacterium]
MTENRDLADDREQTRHQLLERRMLEFAVRVIRQLREQAGIPKSVADQLTLMLSAKWRI